MKPRVERSQVHPVGSMSIRNRLRLVVAVAAIGSAAPFGASLAGLSNTWVGSIALLSVGTSMLLCRQLANHIARRAQALETVVDAVAGGALDTAEGLSRLETSDEIGQVFRALGRMSDGLARTVDRLRGTADGIGQAAAEIAQGNNDLSSRTENTASSLQQTASSMAHLTSTVGSNAESARQANQLALSASAVADRGHKVVGEVVERMHAISERSRRSAEIIGVMTASPSRPTSSRSMRPSRPRARANRVAVSRWSPAKSAISPNVRRRPRARSRP